MANPQIEKLLILQYRDQVVRRLVDQLASIPCEVEAHEAEIEGGTCMWEHANCDVAL